MTEDEKLGGGRPSGSVKWMSNSSKTLDWRLEENSWDT